jgi:hypothetical protein
MHTLGVNFRGESVVLGVDVDAAYDWLPVFCQRARDLVAHD